MRLSAPPHITSPPERPDLSNRRLCIGLLVLGIGLCIYIFVKPMLGADWHRPGTSLMQLVATVGAVLLLIPFWFSLGKRSGFSAVPNRLLILHVGASMLGTALVSLHAFASFEGPPLFMLGFLFLLIITGAIGRLYAGALFAASFAMKPAPFAAHDPHKKVLLRALIDAKIALLKKLDPAAREAVFSVTLAHWIKHPLLSLAYMRLVRREARLIGARQSITWLGAYWRPLHVALAWLFLVGLIVHIVVVTFFAGYVAEGREIYWWHITKW